MTVTTVPALPTVPALHAGEYVNRSLAVSEVGTFTGVPATAQAPTSAARPRALGPGSTSRRRRVGCIGRP